MPQAPSLVAELTALENTCSGCGCAGWTPRTARTLAVDQLRALRARSTRATPCPASSPAGCSSGSPWPEPWSWPPSLLLADEPTGSLDRKTGRQVLARMRRLAALRGAALVIATHDPEVAELLPRRLSVVGDGTVSRHDRAPLRPRRDPAPARRDRRRGPRRRARPSRSWRRWARSSAQTGADLTTRSAARVPVDWQVQLTPGADAAAVAKALAGVPGLPRPARRRLRQGPRPAGAPARPGPATTGRPRTSWACPPTTPTFAPAGAADPGRAPAGVAAAAADRVEPRGRARHDGHASSARPAAGHRRRGGRPARRRLVLPGRRCARRHRRERPAGQRAARRPAAGSPGSRPAPAHRGPPAARPLRPRPASRTTRRQPPTW